VSKSIFLYHTEVTIINFKFLITLNRTWSIQGKEKYWIKRPCKTCMAFI